MPNTTRGYTYPDSAGHDRLWEHFQELATDIDADITSVVQAKTYGKPIGRLIAPTQQNMANGAFVPINFGTASEVVDTHNFHSEVTTNTRVFPTVAGWYRVSGSVYYVGRSDTISLFAAARKNGTTILEGGGRISSAGNVVAGVLCNHFVQMNGTTDYFELIGAQDNTAAVTSTTRVSNYFTSTLEWEYVRA